MWDNKLSTETNGVAATKRPHKLGRKQAVYGYLFLAPTLILFCIFSLVPTAMGFMYSFTDMAPGYPWDFNWTIGQYKYIFSDTVYLHSILNVLVYTLMSVPMAVISSLLVAVLLNRKVRGIKVFRVIYYLPAVTSGVATAFVWRWMFNESHGLFNTILTDWFHMEKGLFVLLPMRNQAGKRGWIR